MKNRTRNCKNSIKNKKIECGKETTEVLKSELRYIQEKFRVKRIGLFGSYVRGEQTKKSDIDILVEFQTATYDNFINLAFFLENLFGKEVDVVTTKSVSPYLAPFIKREVVWCE
jgi:predicted nucleotidyltransferase